MNNKKIGLLREKRVKSYYEKMGFEVIKTSLAEDKYHAIDFKCYKNDKKLMVQVKGPSYIRSEFHTKSIAYAKKHNHQLVYAIVCTKIYFRYFQ